MLTIILIGSASHASAGTTNLHLDISDATNVIVGFCFLFLLNLFKIDLLT